MNLIKKLFSSGLTWLWLSLLVLIIDRLVKIWAVTNLSFAEPLQIWSFFNFTLVYNSGAAFSFFQSASGWQNIFLGGVAAVISIVILVWLARSSSREVWLNISLCLILGGALGNAWDRVLYGYVIDLFDFHINDWHFAIFNIADSGICIGAFMLILYWFYFPRPASRKDLSSE